eukprot:scpid64405/ scgid5573/ 
MSRSRAHTAAVPRASSGAVVWNFQQRLRGLLPLCCTAITLEGHCPGARVAIDPCQCAWGEYAIRGAVGHPSCQGPQSRANAWSVVMANLSGNSSVDISLTAVHFYILVESRPSYV